MKRLLPIIALAVLVLAGCSKEKKQVRQLKGTWDVVSYTSREAYTGDCGTPFGYYNVFTTSNIGTIEFTKEDPMWPSITSDDALKGSWNLSYTYTDPNFGNSYEVNEQLDFDYYIVDEKLVLYNPDEFFFQTYSLEDFDKKRWEMSYAVDQSSLGCNYQEFIYEIEKQ